MSDSQPATLDDVVARIMAETPIGMSAAAKLFGTFKNGKPVHRSTVARWHIDGIQSKDGKSVLKLEAIRINRRLVTSEPRVHAFIRAQQGESAEPATPTPLPRSPKKREKASRAAGEKLKKARA